MPTVSFITCPLTACAKKEEITVESVKIITEIEDLTTDLNKPIKSVVIEAKCFDKDGKELEEFIPTISLKTNDGSDLPPWICLDNQNQICVYKEFKGGTWTFNVQASYEDVFSDVIPVNVTVVDQKLAPDELKIECQDEFDIFAPSSEHININLIAYKEGQISNYCNKSCEWKITDIKSDNPDAKIPSIYLEDLETAACLYCDVGHATDYIGQYDVTIQAQSKIDEKIVCSKTIPIVISNGQDYTDPTTQYRYVKLQNDEGWTLYKIPEKAEKIENVKEDIQGIPVYKIYENMCYAASSEDATLKSIDLPSSITEIGQKAFMNQTNLGAVSMPGLKNVQEYAFSGCKKMYFSTAKPEPQLNEVFKYAFQNCSTLCFKLDQPFYYLHEGAFMNTGIDKLFITKKIYKIEDRVFEGCSSFYSITVDDLTPPILYGNPFKSTASNFKIYVPQSDINDYRTASGWKQFTSIIVGF